MPRDPNGPFDGNWSDVVTDARIAARALTTPARTRIAAGGATAPRAFGLLLCVTLAQAAPSDQAERLLVVTAFAAAHRLPSHVLAVALADAVHAGVLAPTFLMGGNVDDAGPGGAGND